jgi:hypothetical protein
MPHSANASTISPRATERTYATIRPVCDEWLDMVVVVVLVVGAGLGAIRYRAGLSKMKANLALVAEDTVPDVLRYH